MTDIRDESPNTNNLFGRWGRRGTAIIAAMSALVLLIVGATVGYSLGNRSNSTATSNTPGDGSVDAGFLRDMIVHHEQGVLIAHYAEKNSDDAEIGLMAYDINYTQTSQIGQMSGFLMLWELPISTFEPRMAWMAGAEGHMNMGSATGAVNGVVAGAVLMPGMATDAEIAQLAGLTGPASDSYFLQLMVRHHQGGTAMMEYAAQNATNPVVKNLASKMAESQSSEISVMTQMLAQRGLAPLPFDADAPMAVIPTS